MPTQYRVKESFRQQIQDIPVHSANPIMSNFRPEKGELHTLVWGSLIHLQTVYSCILHISRVLLHGTKMSQRTQWTNSMRNYVHIKTKDFSTDSQFSLFFNFLGKHIRACCRFPVKTTEGKDTYMKDSSISVQRVLITLVQRATHHTHGRVQSMVCKHHTNVCVKEEYRVAQCIRGYEEFPTQSDAHISRELMRSSSEQYKRVHNPTFHNLTLIPVYSSIYDQTNNHPCQHAKLDEIEDYPSAGQHAYETTHSDQLGVCICPNVTKFMCTWYSRYLMCLKYHVQTTTWDILDRTMSLETELHWCATNCT
jgi:hypothetical protein